jgi:hypothetical protein
LVPSVQLSMGSAITLYHILQHPRGNLSTFLELTFSAPTGRCRLTLSNPGINKPPLPCGRGDYVAANVGVWVCIPQDALLEK